MTAGAGRSPGAAPSGAVFLSYASEDSLAAERICAALRAVGIEVWLDQSELRGGDAWDEKIRDQIKTCALFMPLISHTTHDRAEGYFRLEWKLAIDRSYLIMSGIPFLVPVAIDPIDRGNVPERFREVQWTQLPDGHATPQFVEHIRRLLAPRPARAGEGHVMRPAGTTAVGPRAGSRAVRVAVWAAAVLLALGGVYLLVDKLGLAKMALQGSVSGAPAHSIAVLPFVNLSGDPKQEYFSDGLTEELLNSLAEIQGLQVAARTSAFSFKGQDTDIGTIARKLNVATVLEGSVRRSEHTVRITAQLINAQTGFHLWSKTYDRDLGDVLKLQTEIATAVANALQVTLLGDVGAKIEVGGTRNPAALDAYLRGKQLLSRNEAATRASIEAYSEALRLDPDFALAAAARALASTVAVSEYATGEEARALLERAAQDADAAVRLAPELGEAHLASANVAQVKLELRTAAREFDRAVALAPGNATILRIVGGFDIIRGRTEEGLAKQHRAVLLDPLNERIKSVYGSGLMSARRYDESLAVLLPYLARVAEDPDATATVGTDYLMKGDAANAAKTCERYPDYWGTQTCAAMAYARLGRRADAERVVAKMKAANGNDVAYQLATIHANWGDAAAALDWLDTAVRVRDPGLTILKTDPLMDSLRKEPRLQAILKQLDFPD